MVMFCIPPASSSSGVNLAVAGAVPEGFFNVLDLLLASCFLGAPVPQGVSLHALGPP